MDACATRGGNRISFPLVRRKRSTRSPRIAPLAGTQVVARRAGRCGFVSCHGRHASPGDQFLAGRLRVHLARAATARGCHARPSAPIPVPSLFFFPSHNKSRIRRGIHANVTCVPAALQTCTGGACPDALAAALTTLAIRREVRPSCLSGTHQRVSRVRALIKAPIMPLIAIGELLLMSRTQAS